MSKTKKVSETVGTFYKDINGQPVSVVVEITQTAHTPTATGVTKWLPGSKSYKTANGEELNSADPNANRNSHPTKFEYLIKQSDGSQFLLPEPS